MVAGKPVVDITIDPQEVRRGRRRAWLRGGISGAGVLLMIAAILAIAVYTDRANRQGVLALSDDLLATLDSRIAVEVSAYLGPATRATRIVRGMLKENALTHPQEAEATAATVLREVPQITNLNFADPDGNYILVRRGTGGGTETKLIENVPGPRRVSWIYRDAAGAEISRKEDPSDSYDPRQRPWYAGAIDADQLFWTNAYVFYTDRRPGITISARYRGPDGRLYVYGVDISLDQFSRFLASLQIGHHGKAIIMSAAGEVIASPAGNVMVEQGKENFVPAKVDKLGDPALTRAYDLFRAEGPGRHIEDLEGSPYIMTVAPLTTGGRDWFILITVPENDFVGFIASSNRPALITSFVIVFVAAVLAVLLVRQSWRTDRTTRLVAERQRAIGRQSAAFAKVAADASLFDPGRSRPPGTLTEALIEVTAGRRASVWRLAGGRLLTCEDSYDRDDGGHTEGLELHRDELPHFIAALEKGEDFGLSDAAKDRRTAEFYRIVMQSFGTRALLVVPIRRESSTIGAVIVEDSPQDPARYEAMRDFALALAEVLASCMTKRPAPPERMPAAPAATTAEPAAIPSIAVPFEMEGIDPANIVAGIYPHAAVMVLQLTDPAAMARRQNSEGRSLADEIVRRAQKLAEENHIPYLKLVGHELWAAAGLDSAGEADLALIADLALTMRDCCMALFEDTTPAFRIGIDCGLAMGSRLGDEAEIFNLWGNAVQTADDMASSALPGTVQVTEAAYQRLRKSFLFRLRGRFYLPRLGEAQTFILASRA
jgi:adenylate cyclase